MESLELSMNPSTENVNSALVGLYLPIMKRYFVFVFFLFNAVACTKETEVIDKGPTPFCAWRFQNQDYVAMNGRVTAGSSMAEFVTDDTLYPMNSLSYITSSVTKGDYPIGPLANSLLFHTSVTLDSIATLTADTGVIHITSLSNSYINSTFTAVFGSDILVGHCDNLKLQ